MKENAFPYQHRNRRKKPTQDVSRQVIRQEFEHGKGRQENCPTPRWEMSALRMLLRGPKDYDIHL